MKGIGEGMKEIKNAVKEDDRSDIEKEKLDT